MLREQHPAILTGRIHTGGDAPHAELDVLVDVHAAFACDAEARDEQRAGESLESVDGSAVATLRAGEQHLGAVGGTVAACTGEETIGVGDPLVTSPVAVPGAECQRRDPFRL